MVRKYSHVFFAQTLDQNMSRSRHRANSSKGQWQTERKLNHQKVSIYWNWSFWGIKVKYQYWLLFRNVQLPRSGPHPGWSSVQNPPRRFSITIIPCSIFCHWGSDSVSVASSRPLCDLSVDLYGFGGFFHSLFWTFCCCLDIIPCHHSFPVQRIKHICIGERQIGMNVYE